MLKQKVNILRQLATMKLLWQINRTRRNRNLIFTTLWGDYNQLRENYASTKHISWLEILTRKLNTKM